jgi:hypothetical protein
MKRTHLLSICFLFISYSLFCQNGYLSGTIRSDSGEPLQFVNLAVKGTSTGTTSDKEGHFTISLPANQRVVLLYTFIGYESDSLVISMKPNERKSVHLSMRRASKELESIEVKDNQIRTNTFNRLNPKVLTYIPTINASIEDLIKTMPGVSSRNELSSQYSVRGGNYDENLVFVNDIEIYRPFLVRSGQQEGQSFLNPDLVAGISFSAGGFDARYGDKMSSVLDIRYKKPTRFAGSFDASLLGANAHVEGLIADKVTFLLGTRYKSNSYVLSGLDTKGNYKPRFFDVQGLLSYEMSKRWELSLLGSYTNNYYKLTPETRETSFGTLDEAYKIRIYFDGSEVDRYRNWLSAATLTFKPHQDLRLKLIGSAYRTHEEETYDISGEYWLGKLEVFSGAEKGQVTEVLGVGAYMEHARNYLDGMVMNLEHRGSWEKSENTLLWGLKYQHDDFTYKVSEWTLQDSAGYSLPRPQDSIGSSNPPNPELVLFDVIRNNNSTANNKLSVFIQNTWVIKKPAYDVALTGGLRAIYYDYNGQFMVNPRINISFKPRWTHETVFRVSGGVYSQPPTFREMTDLRGSIVPGLKSQTAIHVVAGSDYYFTAWERPFKFVAEAYYKYLDNLIPYEIDNLKIRYYGNNDATGYATGIDFRVNGEFVKGVESWASVSFLKTEEFTEGQWVPRPSDQRFNMAIFFQDYIPGFPTWKMNLTLIYGTGLPFGPPDSPRSEQTLRTPPYRRVDIGLTKQILGPQTKYSETNPLRFIENLWISLDIFNLLQISNTVSYQWVTDINGKQYAVPNYLTPRMVNLKLGVEF